MTAPFANHDMKQTERHGYWAVEWSAAWDPSLADVIRLAPALVLGKRIAITSCDSGPYVPSQEERRDGWRLVETTAISKAITRPAELPAPGFDEWYIFDSMPQLIPKRNHVNQYGFSVLDDGDAAESFWKQVTVTKPLHVLGAGTPNMFFVSRDREIFQQVLRLNVAA